MSSPATEAVAVEVQPEACVAPCNIRLAVRIPPHEANRGVTIVAESLDFYRSSSHALDGQNAPRVHELVLKELPAGVYDVRVIVDRSPEPAAHQGVRFAVRS